jgi:alpha-galactosidase
VALFNAGTSTKRLTADASLLGLDGHTFTVTDVWTGAVSPSSGSISTDVPAHGTAVYRIAQVP